MLENLIIVSLVMISVGYFIGSIPFGVIIAKLFKLGNLREIGSGNTGATNVLRTGNKLAAFLTLILDGSKGALVFFLLDTRGMETYGLGGLLYLLAFVACFFAIIGHCYPVWLKFKGGKGVATTLGVLLAAVPFTGLIACVTWLVSAKFGKISSVAAMSAMIVAPVMTYVFYGWEPATVNVLISALVIWRHRENIARIRAGTEPRIGDKKKAPE